MGQIAFALFLSFKSSLPKGTFGFAASVDGQMTVTDFSSRKSSPSVLPSVPALHRIQTSSTIERNAEIEAKVR
jgi:hypothetical protein